MQAELEKLAAENGEMWKRQAMVGDALEGFKLSSHYMTLEDEILKDIERGAFNTLKKSDLDMTNLNHLYQLRALCQAVDLIRKLIDQKIANGKNARAQLKNLNSTPKEGEQ